MNKSVSHNSSAEMNVAVSYGGKKRGKAPSMGCSWANVATSGVSSMEVKYIPPVRNEHGRLVIPAGTLKEGEEKWRYTLIGYFMVKNLKARMIHRRAMFLWARYGLREVHFLDGGFVVLRFENEQGVMGVINRNLWLFMGQQIFLKRWSKEFDYRRDDFKTVTLWVKLYNTPMGYRSPKGVSVIASMVR